MWGGRGSRPQSRGGQSDTGKWSLALGLVITFLVHGPLLSKAFFRAAGWVCGGEALGPSNRCGGVRCHGPGVGPPGRHAGVKCRPGVGPVWQVRRGSLPRLGWRVPVTDTLSVFPGVVCRPRPSRVSPFLCREHVGGLSPDGELGLPSGRESSVTAVPGKDCTWWARLVPGAVWRGDKIELWVKSEKPPSSLRPRSALSSRPWRFRLRP